MGLPPDEAEMSKLNATFCSGIILWNFYGKKNWCLNFFINDFSYNTIRRNANGITKSGCGYVWRYIGKPKKDFVRTTQESKNRKPVIQLSKSGEFICEYNSIRDASKATGFLPENIGRAAKGITSKSYKGYIWVFKDDLQ